jgi:hypothetical protein
LNQTPQTLACVVYPKFIWDRSCERHPPGEDYDWRSHFRCIVALAREVAADPKGIAGVYWLGAGESERWFIQSLANVDCAALEVFMLEMEANPRGWSHPLEWLDPNDPHLKPAAAEPARRRAE